jgi:hypothetical protein
MIVRIIVRIPNWRRNSNHVIGTQLVILSMRTGIFIAMELYSDLTE